MSPAELMAMAQQMRPQQASTPVSAHDQELAGRIGAYPQTAQVEQNIQKVRAAEGELISHWQSQVEALHKEERQKRAALPPCHTDAGEPSGIARRDLALAYADKRNRSSYTLLAEIAGAFSPAAHRTFPAHRLRRFDKSSVGADSEPLA